MLTKTNNQVIAHIAGEQCSWARLHNITELIKVFLVTSHESTRRELLLAYNLWSSTVFYNVHGGYFAMPDLDYPMTSRAITVVLLQIAP